jgi:hypothetical protein
MSAAGSEVRHLARRFVRAVVARPPTPKDEAWVDRHLSAGERALWVKMSDADRAHAIVVARRFDELVEDAPRAALAAALLHDVGKLDAGLGTWARVLATVVGPRGRRFRTYHDHERLGAAMLEAVGSDPLTVALVDPEGSPPDHLRAALARADAI